MRRRVLREPLIGVLLLVAFGLWLIWLHHPRKGLAAIALAFALAALARLLMSPHDAGLLAVRSRTVETPPSGSLSYACPGSACDSSSRRFFTKNSLSSTPHSSAFTPSTTSG